MGKKNKQQSYKQIQTTLTQPSDTATHAPAKEPTLLAVSIVLFALWFTFLLITAIFG